MDSSTPIPIDIKNFLMSDKKQLERDDSSIELEARMGSGLFFTYLRSLCRAGGRNS